MNITYLCHRVPYPPNKGEKLRTFHQIKHLKAIGYELTVLAPTASASEVKDADDLSQALGIRVITGMLPSKPVRLFNAIIKNQSFSEANFFSTALHNKIAEAYPNADVLILSASSLLPYIKPFMSALKPKQTLIMDFMDVDSDKWEQYAEASKFPVKYVYKREAKKIRELEKDISQSFDECFLIADAEVNVFKQKVDASSTVKVLGNGIEQDVFSPMSIEQSSALNKRADLTFLFVGVMDYKPNIDAVEWFYEQCWPSILQKVPNAKLVIAGMNPTNSIIKIGQDPTVEVTGFVESVIPIFQSADVFIAPFRIARGVQNKVIQAMSCALPVVSTSMGTEGIICQHEESIMEANTQDKFTNYCIDLANDKQKRTDLGRRARQVILDHYAWESVLKPLEKSISAGTNTHA